MIIFGPDHWHGDVDACTKHGVPHLPCPACLADQDPQIQAMLDQDDRAALDWNPELTVSDLLPAEHPWLIDRIA